MIFVGVLMELICHELEEPLVTSETGILDPIEFWWVP